MCMKFKKLKISLSLSLKNPKIFKIVLRFFTIFQFTSLSSQNLRMDDDDDEVEALQRHFNEDLSLSLSLSLSGKRALVETYPHSHTHTHNYSYIKGIALGKTGQIKDAVESLSRVLRINPHYETVRVQGMHLASLGLYTLALEDYNEAIKMILMIRRVYSIVRRRFPDWKCSRRYTGSRCVLEIGTRGQGRDQLRENTHRRLHRKRRREDEAENEDMTTLPQSPKKNEGEKKPCPTTPRSALKKRGESRKKRTKTPKKRVAFNQILIREFNRELGGSGVYPKSVVSRWDWVMSKEIQSDSVDVYDEWCSSYHSKLSTLNTNARTQVPFTSSKFEG